MSNETAAPEAAADQAGRAMSDWLAANYSEAKSENECNICKRVKQTQEPTEWDIENLQPGYGGVFWCGKYEQIVNAWGHCDSFDYFDE